MRKKTLISASFLSCVKIMPAIKKLNLTDVDYIHVDFIDGKCTDKAVRGRTGKPRRKHQRIIQEKKKVFII